MSLASSASPLNVLGEPLVVCGCAPMTGWYRDGSCRTDAADLGRHTVCCVVNDAFLSYSKAQGNDLSTPVPAFDFPGLKAGDHWCVCAPGGWRPMKTAWHPRCAWKPRRWARSR